VKVVVLDACVLVPMPLRDTLLRFARHNFYRARWSELILDEMQRTLVRDLARSERQAQRAVEAVSDAFPDALIMEGEVVPSIPGVDAKDQHVVAAAIRSSADVIVTLNLRHFPIDACEPLGIEPLHPDRFLVELFDREPRYAVGLLHQQAMMLGNPPLTIVDVVANLRQFAPEFCSLVIEQMWQDVNDLRSRS
jgi:hypothetical protein